MEERRDQEMRISAGHLQNGSPDVASYTKLFLETSPWLMSRHLVKVLVLIVEIFLQTHARLVRDVGRKRSTRGMYRVRVMVWSRDFPLSWGSHLMKVRWRRSWMQDMSDEWSGLPTQGAVRPMPSHGYTMGALYKYRYCYRGGAMKRLWVPGTESETSALRSPHVPETSLVCF